MLKNITQSGVKLVQYLDKSIKLIIEYVLWVDVTVSNDQVGEGEKKLYGDNKDTY